MIGQLKDRMATMTINNVDVDATIERVKVLIAEEKERACCLMASLLKFMLSE